MTNQINAFHPDYCKIYMPEFLTTLRLESKQTHAGQALSKHVETKRKTVPSHGTIPGISKNPLPLHMNRPKEMMRPSKTRSQIMSEFVAKKRETNMFYGTALPESANIPDIKPKEVKKGNK